MRLLAQSVAALVIILVVAIAAFGVYRLTRVFGKTEITRQGSGLANDTKAGVPTPRPWCTRSTARRGPLPPSTTSTWTRRRRSPATSPCRGRSPLTTTAAAASANIVAQGDGDTIGCRITVNGELKDEKTSTGVNAQTFCLVKSA